ncbi:branched-chain amino acid ABC transporter permease [Parageobacillus thermoglucosidasius]|uniref:branched-chain amino acid ABC transporter permease n=1 Tax=Parageobacillus thermoglucosidasius TaxID=1426 RepID=UPI000B56AB6F|nr:branched-chain amino acid ABC transporter permease [Parageobacillus thermoglucosidasius]OUM88008.1 MAG: hypothetical protein BAA00_19985 [Parageobacillus thermoglucosidasius]
MDQNRLKIGFVGVVLLAVILYGFLNTEPYLSGIFIWICLNIVLAVTLRFVMLIGEINLAHAGFFGIGAYTSAVLTVHFGWPFFIAFFISGIIASLLSILFGAIAFRLKGAYFLLISFALAEVIRLIFENFWTDILGGHNGIIGIQKPMEAYNGFITVISVLLILVFYFLEKSDFGKTMMAIKNSDELSRSIGINIMKYKILVLAIASFAAGLAGSMFAHFNAVISSLDFTFLLSIMVLAYVIIGGQKSFFGPIVGTIVLCIIAELIRGIGPYEQLAYGLAIIIAMLFFREGLVGKLGQVLSMPKITVVQKRQKEEA